MIASSKNLVDIYFLEGIYLDELSDAFFELCKIFVGRTKSELSICVLAASKHPSISKQNQ
jgi:hypothetical protein